MSAPQTDPHVFLERDNIVRHIDGNSDKIVLPKEKNWKMMKRAHKLLAHFGLSRPLSPVRYAHGYGAPGAPSRPKPTGSVDGVRVEVKSQLKYLGLILDSHWSFEPHWTWMAARLCLATLSLARIMPNLGGPGEGVRRLYMGVVRSIALYGAPVWWPPQEAWSCSMERNVKYPSEWQEQEVYNWKEEHARGIKPVAHESLLERKARAKREEFRHWQERLPHARVGLRVVEAIGPLLEQWVGRGGGVLSFHMTQVLTGHGCFGEHLHERTGREPTTRCHHCPEPRDTAQHTLKECPALANERALVAVVGDDLFLSTVGQILEGPEK
ncbi:uncharacterized protein LOC105197338 [Solenopsis invicta]|uniref:uncharacterized protein LOC105197338 n=1 Tax=Solenopsis invicta TaxID=13686 RepID=UPI00193EA0A0|nr:uncharacterized protein LOC105197338 [Solenopsis invicta]